MACSAGGMALSTLVPATVSSVSSLAKTPVLGLKIWALHGLLLTIEAAGLSFVSHVQVKLYRSSLRLFYGHFSNFAVQFKMISFWCSGCWCLISCQSEPKLREIFG